VQSAVLPLAVIVGVLPVPLTVTVIALEVAEEPQPVTVRV